MQEIATATSFKKKKKRNKFITLLHFPENYIRVTVYFDPDSDVKTGKITKAWKAAPHKNPPEMINSRTESAPCMRL